MDLSTGWPDLDCAGGGIAPGAPGGVRVPDFFRVLSGMFAPMGLADHGADVIKIGAPGRGDDTRHCATPVGATTGKSSSTASRVSWIGRDDHDHP